MVSAILVLFLVNGLDMGKDVATAVYHAFIFVCYFSPVLGAMLSDGWLGKFRFSCFLYSIGIFYADLLLSHIGYDRHVPNFIKQICSMIL